MKARPTQAPPPAVGSVRADEVMPLREFGRRLGLGRQILCSCQRGGLRTFTVGRVKLIRGADALAWFAQQAAKQAAGGGDE